MKHMHAAHMHTGKTLIHTHKNNFKNLSKNYWLIQGQRDLNTGRVSVGLTLTFKTLISAEFIFAYGSKLTYRCILQYVTITVPASNVNKIIISLHKNNCLK